MKDLQWNSAVRVVEAETGWPRPLCRRIALGPGRDWLRTIWAIWVLLVCLPLAVFCVILALRPDAGLGWDRFAMRLALIAVAGVIAMMAVNGARAARARRMLPRFFEAPWCPNCRYPVPPLQDGASVCPECGEPIPPEIATLAAQRAAGKRETP